MPEKENPTYIYATRQWCLLLQCKIYTDKMRLKFFLQDSIRNQDNMMIIDIMTGEIKLLIIEKVYRMKVFAYDTS